MCDAKYRMMREFLARKTMRELREIAKSEGICLGYDGSRKSTAIAAIVETRRYRDLEGRHE